MSHWLWHGHWVAPAAGCVLAGLMAGCGQKGPLYIPNTPEAAQRATLPQTLFGGGEKSNPKSPGDGAKSPAKPAATP